MPWLNTAVYSPFELGICLIGSILWVCVYFSIIRNAYKNRFMELAMLAIAGNISWEFLYSFFYDKYINLGLLYVWAYRAWFFVDVWIVVLLLRYGYKQTNNMILRNHFTLIFFALFALMLMIVWSFNATGFDNMPVHDTTGAVRLGGASAYVLNLIISMGYLHLYVRYRKRYHFSISSAWMKMVGTLCFTVFFMMRDPQNMVLLSLAIVVFLMDTAYIIIRHLYPPLDNVAANPDYLSFPLNPVFERLWQEHPGSRSYYEVNGKQLRQISFDHWQYRSKISDYRTKYWVMEGTVLRQLISGKGTEPEVAEAKETMRGITRETDLEDRIFYGT